MLLATRSDQNCQAFLAAVSINGSKDGYALLLSAAGAVMTLFMENV